MGLVGRVGRRAVVEHVGGRCNDRLLDPPDLLRVMTAAGSATIAVCKSRERFRLDGQRGEVTTVTVEGSPLVRTCVVVEGWDLDELVRIRRRLRLEGASNVPVHQALVGATGHRAVGLTRGGDHFPPSTGRPPPLNGTPT
jgi:hypothetical protein